MPPPVLLLVDFQKGFEEIAALIPRNNLGAEAHAMRLVGFWREAGMPVIHIRHDSTEAGSVLRPGTPGNAAMEFAAEAPGEPVLRRTVDSAFVGTDLAERLEALGRPDVVVAGIPTDHCVSTTVRMGASLGFRMLLAADACFTFDRRGIDGRTIPAAEVHDVNLASLAGEFARVVSSGALLAELRARAPAPP